MRQQMLPTVMIIINSDDNDNDQMIERKGSFVLAGTAHMHE